MWASGTGTCIQARTPSYELAAGIAEGLVYEWYSCRRSWKFSLSLQNRHFVQSILCPDSYSVSDAGMCCPRLYGASSYQVWRIPPSPFWVRWPRSSANCSRLSKHHPPPNSAPCLRICQKLSTPATAIFWSEPTVPCKWLFGDHLRPSHPNRAYRVCPSKTRQQPPAYLPFSQVQLQPAHPASW